MDKSIDEILEEFLNRWQKEIKLEKKRITKVVFTELNPIFNDYDSWKTATKDDYVEEKSISCFVDQEEVLELIRNRWHEEFNKYSFQEAEYDMEFMYKESCSLFNYILTNYEKNYEFEY